MTNLPLSTTSMLTSFMPEPRLITDRFSVVDGNDFMLSSNALIFSSRASYSLFRSTISSLMDAPFCPVIPLRRSMPPSS